MILNDDFNRTTLNPAWVKSGGNPEIGVDHADPFLYYESGTYYLFCVDRIAKVIESYTSADLLSWSGPTTKVVCGTASAWDDFIIEGPHIVKANGVYYLFYGGNITSGGSGTTWKIGYATSSTINGTYTKYGSNPIINRTASGKGVNDVCVYYNASLSTKWQLFCTSGSAGNQSDVADGDFARFTADTPDGTWTDQGNIATGLGQDPDLIADGTMLLMQYTPVGAATTKELVSSDRGVTWTTLLATSLLDRVLATWEANIYAPSITTNGTTYAMAYEGSAAAEAVGIATNSRIHRWIPNVADAFDMPSAYLHTTTPSPMDFTNCRSEYTATPPYTLQCDFYVESQIDSGIFTLGWHVAQSASLFYQVFVNAAAGRVYTYSSAALTSDTQLHASAVFSIPSATWHTILVRVTATSLSVDLYNGSWQTSVVSETGLTLIGARPAIVAYAPASNLSRFRNFVLDAPATSTAPVFRGS